MEIMQQIGITPSVIRAGKANMFLSPVFRKTVASVSGATIELYNTDGSVGAARGAALGCGFYKNSNEAFASLTKLATITPDNANQTAYNEAFQKWKDSLKRIN